MNLKMMNSLGMGYKLVLYQQTSLDLLGLESWIQSAAGLGHVFVIDHFSSHHICVLVIKVLELLVNNTYLIDGEIDRTSGLLTEIDLPIVYIFQ